MDFFSAVVAGSTDIVSEHAVDDTKTFADAIAARFGQGDQILTARLLPPLSVRMPSTPMANLSLSIRQQPLQPEPGTFTAVPPLALSSWIDDPSTLIVDIRPHAAYSSARICRAISLSVPSTLLKRPLFSLQRLSAMLPSSSARSRFSAWRTAPRILVYDADSPSLSDTSNIQGLLRKFLAESPPGATIDLAWVQGGFQAVWRDRRDLVDAVPPTPETETEDEEDDADYRVLRAHNLPQSAFALSSTTSAQTRPSTRPGKLFRDHPPTPRTVAHAALAGSAQTSFNPFFDTVRQNTELSHGITERIPLRLPRRVRRRISELPFQWLRDIARRAGADDSSDSSSNTSGSAVSARARHAAQAEDVEEGSEALAMQFYRIELAEQRRLMGVMEHHSRESDGGGVGGVFPFSITAGFEKGSKNRYRHIWPFEHARVRLHRRSAPPRTPPSPFDDYVNASYVQPLCTTRRYIATQGPLEATYGDFWNMCWQQDVRVIVMLTQEVEGSMVKCGRYWTEGTCAVCGFADVSAHSASTATTSTASSAGGFFQSASTTNSTSTSTPAPQLIKRFLRVTHAAYPDAPPRRVVQLQYLGWPDMNVPEDARGVLGLVWEVGRVMREVGGGGEGSSAEGGDGSGRNGSEVREGKVDPRTGVVRRAGPAPVLLHCSAGVGRTGGFIAVDAVLDAVRREVREWGVQGEGEDRMDVDVEVPAPVGLSLNGGGGLGVSGDAPLSMNGIGNGMLDGGPGMSPDGMRTPMQVDSEGSVGRWAERVADTKGVSASFPTTSTSFPSSLSSAAAFPLSAVSSSASLFPSSGPTEVHARLQAGGAHRGRYNTSASIPSGFSLTLPTHIQPRPHNSDPTAHMLAMAQINSDGAINKAVSLPTATHASLPAAGNAPLPLAVRRGYADHRLRTFSDPSAADTRPPAVSATSSSTTSSGEDSSEQKSNTERVDYKLPRALHAQEGAAPVRLSAMEDPIWEVVQDMREQRMSLCQSLRQYVFVHAAIIEGALMVLDEERAALGLGAGALMDMMQPGGWRGTQPQLHPVCDESQSTSSTGKRLASPTELPKEDKKGEIVLSKRPSIKRKQPSMDEYSAPPLPTYPPP
ncbi:hypothetical protein C8J57DRAFT_1043427 [Mycena rebaudengoi]|nr:hypothetical protein C8J57DRAFT_1043427 [Mycena rebaudengoi]